ncbi:MAG: hypothetical protein R3Y12_04255 [Clostridia bacterium]
MEEYKSNSNKQKDKKVEQIVNGNVRTKKKSDIQKITDIFVTEDIDSVKSYIIMDVLVPAVKKAVSDIVTNGIDMLLYGETSKTNKKNNASKVSYRNYYDKDEGRRDYNRTRTRSNYDFDDVILDNRGEAEEVLCNMDDLISKYGMVSVADLYDLVGITGNYTDNKYGWTDIRNASVVRIRDGYALKLPKAVALN